MAWQGVLGSYAEQVVAPAWQLLPVPDGVSDEQAAALPVQSLTAHYPATTSYRIQPGDHVVIHAGEGGVGLLPTQLAKLLVAKVYATVSTGEGEPRVLTRSSGMPTSIRLFAAALFGQSSGPVPPFDLARLGHSGSLTVTRPTLRDFVGTPAELLRRSTDLWRWVSDGRLGVRIGRTFRFAEASLAHEVLQARRTTGKVLLLP